MNNNRPFSLRFAWLACLALAMVSGVQAQVVNTVAGGGDGNGPMATDLDLDQVTGLARDAQGRLLVGSHGLIHRINADGTATRIAGIPGTVTWRPTEGLATSIALGRLKSVAGIPAGDVFYADNGPYSRRINTSGMVSNVTGMGWPSLPAALAADRTGRMHAASPQQVFRADLVAGNVTLVAGNGDFTDTGDGGPATEAGFEQIRALAFDRQNRLLVATANGIRRVEADGTVDTLLNARGVNGMDVGPDGTIYYATGNQVMAVDAGGTVTVYAGLAEGGMSGDGGLAIDARFNGPSALLANDDGSLLVADTLNQRVRHIAAGEVTLAPPAPPQKPGAARIGNEVWVDINPSLGDGGSPITGYTVSSIPEGGIDPAPGSLTMSRSIGGLQGGTAYRFVVRASNAIGTSSASPSSNPVIAPTIELPTLTVGSAQVEEGNAGTRTVTLPVTLSFPLADDFAFDISTVAGTATAGEDFVMRNNVALVIPTNQTEIDFSFEIVGDTLQEADETVLVRVSGTSGLAQQPTDGVVTILNDDATVTPLPRRDLEVLSRSGRFTQSLQDLPAMPAAVFRTTPLAPALSFALTPGVDDAPASPWDSAAGRAYQVFAFDVADGAQNVPHIVHVDALQTTGGDRLDLYLGLDLNGDGLPQANEVRCVDAQSPSPGCDAQMPAPSAGVGHYWVMLHNRNAGAASANLLAFDVPLLPSDGSFVATGPGMLPANEAFDLLLSWRDLGLLEGERRLGYVWLDSSPGETIGGFPVRLHRTANVEEPILLTPAVPTGVRLAPGGSHRRIFLDVPEGSTRLRVTSSAPDNSFTMQLVHAGADDDAADTSVPEAPQAGVALALSKRGSAVQAVPDPGRWYVVASNTGVAPGEMILTATIEGAAPQVRPGSYFNGERPGHGLFLYPAGNQWAGLWYAYANDGGPTWYYLQGLAPGADGVWTGELYRAAWNGSSNLLVDVGVATVAPSGPDAFTFSYTIDGLSGSEPMASLGRGCPTSAGLPQDLSSHWFDPARAGTGFSVQMWENYEYFAAFIYDARGVPRFLAAERSGFGGAEATLALQQLSGSCPTCVFTPSQRSDVGTLLRRVSGGSLDTIELDLEFADGVPGLWSSIDNLELLGGPGTTQGCAP